MIIGSSIENGTDYHVSLDALMETHTRIQGATGAGKSRLLLALLREMIDRGYPTILIDGKGDLVDSVERELAWQAIGPDRVAIIDPADTRHYAPGFNPLALDGREPYARAKTIVGAFKKLFGEEGEFKPWLEKILLASLVPLIHAGLGILELEAFLHNDRLRDVLVQATGERRLQEFWSYIDSLSANERSAQFEAALGRAALLWSSGEGLKRILGQLQDSLDWQKILRPGGIFLVNANTSRGVDADAAQFLGTLCFQKIIEVASQRPKHDRVPTFLVVDEFQRFASGDVVEALEELRGFGVHLVLAHQFLDQLEEVPKLRGAVDSCAQNRILFSTSAVDAEELQAELFTGYRPDRGIIQEIHGPVFAPTQRWVDVESVTETSESETYVPDVVSHQSGGSSVRHNPRTRSYHYEPFALYHDGKTVGRPNDAVTESGATSSRTEGYTTYTSPTRSVTTSRQLVTEYEERDQLMSRQLEGLEDLKEHGRAALMRQPQRHCLVQLQSQPPTALRVGFVEDRPISDKTLALWRKLIYRTYPRGELVDQVLETRIDTFLEEMTPTYANTQTTIRIPKTKPPAAPAKRRKPRQ